MKKLNVRAVISQVGFIIQLVFNSKAVVSIQQEDKAMSIFTSEAQVGDIDVARSMYGDEVRLVQNDEWIIVSKDKIKPMIEALLYVQEKL